MRIMIQQERSVKEYKRRFDSDLRHIKITLMRKKRSLHYDQWKNLVNETKKTILENPSEFFCRELPSSEIITLAIEKVFEDFFIDQKIRAVQNNKVIQKENNQIVDRPVYNWITRVIFKDIRCKKGN